MILTPTHREVLISIAAECAGTMDYQQLRAFYRKMGTQALVDAVGVLTAHDLIRNEPKPGALSNDVRWVLTDKGIKLADDMIRARGARELLPFELPAVRFITWLIQASGPKNLFIPVREAETSKFLNVADHAAGVQLLARKLLDWDKEKHAVRVNCMGRSALEISETMRRDPRFRDIEVTYVDTFQQMLGVHGVKSSKSRKA